MGLCHFPWKSQFSLRATISAGKYFPVSLRHKWGSSESRIGSIRGHEHRTVLETVVGKTVVSHGVRVMFTYHNVFLLVLIVDKEETELNQMRAIRKCARQGMSYNFPLAIVVSEAFLTDSTLCWDLIKDELQLRKVPQWTD